MKKMLGLLLALLPVASVAQVPVYRASNLQVDSVATLRELFTYNRQHARHGALLAGVIIGLQPVSFIYKAENPPFARGLGLSLAILELGFLPGEIRGWHRFSKRSEEQAVRRLERHQPQPHYLQRALFVLYQAPLPAQVLVK